MEVKQVLSLVRSISNIDRMINLFQTIGISIEDDMNPTVGFYAWNTYTILEDALFSLLEISDENIKYKISSYIRDESYNDNDVIVINKIKEIM